MRVKKIISDEVYLTNFARYNYKADNDVDIPYTAGIFTELIPKAMKSNSTVENFERRYINQSLMFNETIKVGKRGLYFFVLQKGFKINKMIYTPDQMTVDLLIHKDNRLIYSFYNPTPKSNINIRGTISQDIDKTSVKLRANLDDIKFRNYFIKLATEGYEKDLQIPEYFPTNMTAPQAASYLNVQEKTIRKWTSEKKIPFTKIGNTVRYRISDLDEYLTKNTSIPKKRK